MDISARAVCHFSVFDTHLATQRLRQRTSIGVCVPFLILKLTGKNPILLSFHSLGSYCMTHMWGECMEITLKVSGCLEISKHGQ